MISILYYGLSGNRGGIENYLLKICSYLDKKKFSIAFIDETGGKACHRKKLEEMGAAFYDITHRNQSVLKNKQDLNNLFGSEKFDILHFNCNTLSYIEPIIQARKYGVKVIIHSRSSNSPSRLITLILHWVNKIRIRKWNIVRLAVSDLAGKWLFGNTEFTVINNGIEIEKFTFDCSKRKRKREELGLGGKVVYGNVGAFLEAKNHGFILSVFREIYNADRNAVLLLVGDGKLKQRYQAEVEQMGLENAVLFLGIRTDVAELMMSMDCMIFPSLYEGFPNAVLEAETTGLPIVVSENITNEVNILEQCVRLSLNEGCAVWADACSVFARNSYNRYEAAKVIYKKGFSVMKEIRKLETIYE